MNDERDRKTRQAAREDHAVWLSQHAAWAGGGGLTPLAAELLERMD